MCSYCIFNNEVIYVFTRLLMLVVLAMVGFIIVTIILTRLVMLIMIVEVIGFEFVTINLVIRKKYMNSVKKSPVYS